MQTYHSASGSVAEDLFIELFSETFGAEKAGYLYSQYHFYDIYQNSVPMWKIQLGVVTEKNFSKSGSRFDIRFRFQRCGNLPLYGVLFYG